MKITIDNTNKTIKVEEPVNLLELSNYLATLNIPLNEYSLISTIVYYSYIPSYPYYPVAPISPTYVSSYSIPQ